MFLIIITFMTILFGFVEARFILPLSLPLGLKITLSLFLVLGIVNIPIVLSYGSVWPVWISRIFSVAQILLIYLFLAVLILEVIRLAHFPAQQVIAFVFLAGCILISAISVFNAGRQPVVKELDITSYALPATWHPLKIVQLTDLHIGQGLDRAWLEKVVKKTNSLNPDLILITGDSIDNTTEKLLTDMMPLKDLSAPLGVFMVFGNHEYYYHPTQWRQAFSDMGIHVLKNQNVILTYNDHPFVLGGADFGARFQSENASKILETTFAESDTTLPRILMTHYPLAFPSALFEHIVLQVSGHTHGGMIFPVNYIVSYFNGGFLRGLFKKEEANLYVSDGTGLWGGFPARLNTQNEITLITLKRPTS